MTNLGRRGSQIWVTSVDINRILAQATVDDLGQGNWSVEVNGQPPHDHRRVYTLRAKDDKTAAFEGIERFTEEMEALGDASNGDG